VLWESNREEVWFLPLINLLTEEGVKKKKIPGYYINAKLCPDIAA